MIRIEDAGFKFKIGQVVRVKGLSHTAVVIRVTLDWQDPEIPPTRCYAIRREIMQPMAMASEAELEAVEKPDLRSLK